MSIKKQPKPPDPFETARAQSEANTLAARESAQLNQINQVTPFGNVSFSGQIGTPGRTQTTTLSPQEQAKLDLANTFALEQGGLGLEKLGQLPRDLVTLEGLPERVTGIETPELATEFGPFGDVSTLGAGEGRVDFEGNPILPGVGDFAGERQRIEQSLFGADRTRIERQVAEDRERLATTLIDQGIPRGSEAFNAEIERLERSRTDALQQASSAATRFAGEEQGRLFGQGLSARQLAGGEDIATAGSSLAALAAANQAQGQQFGQAGTLAEFGNLNRAALSDAEFRNAQLQNVGRQAGLTEQQTVRNQQINELAALVQGTQAIGQPQPNPLAAFGVSAPPIADLINRDFDIRNARSASSLGALGGLAGALGPSLISAFAGGGGAPSIDQFGKSFFSSRDFKTLLHPLSLDEKTGVRQISDAVKALPIWLWSYNTDAPVHPGEMGTPRIGPMAEDFNDMFRPDKVEGHAGRGLIEAVDAIGALFATAVDLLRRVEVLEGASA